MYFFQECGEPLRLRFTKGPYGPYAENLPHVLDVMNNIYIKGFDNRENAPDKEIDIIDNAYGKALDFLKDNYRTHNYKQLIVSPFSTRKRFSKSCRRSKLIQLPRI